MAHDKPLHILVFDDDPSITRLFDLILSGEGRTVQTFLDPSYCDVYQKKHLCQRDAPCADVIISDIMMPKMNGIELFRMQRERGCQLRPDNKALMSAKVDKEYQAAVKELGCHFIRKPFQLSAVLEWVDGCAQRREQDHKLD